VFAGGCLGALARAGLAEVFTMPWGTLVANIAGSFLLGYVATRSPRLLGTGFCGALTTFSTFQVELLDLRPGLAVLYAAASISAGYAALVLGRR